MNISDVQTVEGGDKASGDGDGTGRGGITDNLRLGESTLTPKTRGRALTRTL